MGLIAVIIMGLAVAMDATAVSLAASTTGHIDNKRAVFRLAFHFGLFQGMMPIIGWDSAHSDRRQYRCRTHDVT